MDALNVAGPLLAAAGAALVLGPSPGQARLRRLLPRQAEKATSVSHSPAGSVGHAALSGRRARVAAAVLVAALGAWMLGGTVGVVGGPAIAVAAWVGLGRFEPAHSVRAREEKVRALPLAAELLAAAVSAGSPTVPAAETVGAAVRGPLGAALTAAAASARVGVAPSAAWLALADDDVALRPLARALAGAALRGASPVAVLERVALDARDTARWAAEARVRSLGARAAAPLGLCFLPAFVLVGIVPLVASAGPLLP